MVRFICNTVSIITFKTGTDLEIHYELFVKTVPKKMYCWHILCMQYITKWNVQHDIM